MISIIDTTNSQRIELPSLDENDAVYIGQKGWSFSYVYNFTEIRDIYLALKKRQFLSLKEFTNFCINIKLPYVKTKWNSRRVLEHLNALKNFELIAVDYSIKRSVFEKSSIGDEMSSEDLEIFKEIFFTYFRFKEILLWFINLGEPNRINLINQTEKETIICSSSPLFSFSEKSRFTDAFFVEIINNPLIYYINTERNEDLMRFWDVFVKWGTVLGILEKFNLRNVGIKTINDKSISCTYILNTSPTNLNLLSYINDRFKESYIYIPTLVLDLALTLRLRIEQIHKIIIEQYKVHKEFLSFERTSEIFVKKSEIVKGDKIFFPKYNDSYVSHLIIRK